MAAAPDVWATISGRSISSALNNATVSRNLSWAFMVKAVALSILGSNAAAASTLWK
jgi:hypothetical protein